jgi:hypothetical protein
MPRLSSATDTWHPSNSAVYTNGVDSSVVLVTPVRSVIFRHEGCGEEEEAEEEVLQYDE